MADIWSVEITTRAVTPASNNFMGRFERNAKSGMKPSTRFRGKATKHVKTDRMRGGKGLAKLKASVQSVLRECGRQQKIPFCAGGRSGLRACKLLCVCVCAEI